MDKQKKGEINAIRTKSNYLIRDGRKDGQVMKHKIAVLIAFIFFIGPIICIFGIAGESDLEVITVGQAFVRLFIALAVLGIDAVLVSYLSWKEGKA